MPQLNRDKESLYPPGKLSVWFLGSSALLVAALVWMLADDFVRPWKTVQREFYERDAGILAIQKEWDEAKIREDEKTSARLKELSVQIAAAERALSEPAMARSLAEWQAAMTEQTALMDEADAHIKMAKGDYSARRFAYEIALFEEQKEVAKELASTINQISSEQETWERKRLDAVVAKQQAQFRIEDAGKALKALKKERDEVFKDRDRTNTAYTGADARTTQNQWRNAPIADIVSPSIKIDKVVLEYIHEDFNFATSPKVDMCMTCHRGIDHDEMSEAKVGPLLAWYLKTKLGDKAWAKLGGADWLEHPTGRRLRGEASGPTLREWLSGTPSLLDAFPKEKLLPALGGVVRDAKTGKDVETEDLTRWRDRHLGGKSLEEGGTELLAPFAIRRVEWAHPHLEMMVSSKSPHPMEGFGCTTCHEGQGRRLDFVRATHTPNSEEQMKVWRETRKWVEPEDADQPMLPMRHVQGQCFKCHGPNVEMPPHPEVLEAWITKRDENGEEILDKDKKPIRVKRALAPQPVDGTTADADGRWHPEVYELGADTIRRMGCLGCHVVKGFGSSPGYPRIPTDETPSAFTQAADFSKAAPGSLTASGLPKVGPDLTHIREKLTWDFGIRWIEAPTAYRIDTRMPAFYRHVLHDNRFFPTRDADGKLQEATVVINPTAQDREQINVELLALATYLFKGQYESRPGDNGPRITKTLAELYPQLYSEEIPKGDAKKGQELFYSVGCFGCHLGPDDHEGSGLDEHVAARFSKTIGEGAEARPRRTELPPGPRLTALGSKIKDPKWLFAWLAEPRHYSSVTRMPNLRWRDELGPDGKTVVRTASQQRADLIAYLLPNHDQEFEKREAPDPDHHVRWTEESKKLLVDFWVEWNKTEPDPKDPERQLTLTTEQATGKAWKMLNDSTGAEFTRLLSDVGYGLVRARGCFACHNIQGFEYAQPIGKELTPEGSQYLTKFDFGLLGYPKNEKNELGKGVEESRWGFIEEKLRQPRIFDLGKFKPRWPDKLRMPKFNLRDDERDAVATVVLGFMKEPIKPGAMYSWPTDMTKIWAGRAVIERYGCNQCHTIERRLGVLSAVQLEQGAELWVLPPNLYGEGNRVKADWLFKFLKHPVDVRPSVIQRMPMFRMTDEEATALVDYFQALAKRRDRLSTDPDDQPLDATPYPEALTLHAKFGAEEKAFVVHNAIEEAKALFEVRNCVKCHLPKGTPGADPNDAQAPSFALARERLRQAWMYDMVHDPQRQIQGTKMPSFWPAISAKRQTPGHTMSVDFPEFLTGARGLKDPTSDAIADEQMRTLVRYLLWHYEAAAGTPVGK